jgi:hypothetical protein
MSLERMVWHHTAVTGHADNDNLTHSEIKDSLTLFSTNVTKLFSLNKLPCFKITKMEQHIFKFSLTIDGATEKVSLLKMPLELIYNKKLFKRTKCIFEITERFKL